jgi:NAD(P)-dependent dehydrogenase (short-subunit alcohol dehydrogenase family)
VARPKLRAARYRAAAVSDVLQLLRPGLLEGRAVATAGPARPAVADALAGLGADVRALDADLADEAAADAAAVAAGAVSALVVDAAAPFAAAAAEPDEVAPLRAAADRSWAAARAVATHAWVREDGAGISGKLVLVAPAPGDGPHAGAARDALENMARTLSIEWSRHGIRTTAIAPGAATAAAEVAALVAYLVSPAGDYFSGCRLDLS